jgi:hypothetical protein
MLGCTPTRTTSSAPRRNRGGGERSALDTPFGEDLGFPSSLPLLYTMMCSQFNSVPFPFLKNCPLAVTASYGLVLCMIKFSFGRITPLFASLHVVTAHIRLL